MTLQEEKDTALTLLKATFDDEKLEILKAPTNINEISEEKSKQSLILVP